jgi:thiol-disulfide isomerase/thioredoxin
MSIIDQCILINSEKELEEILKTRNNIFILFYAQWCPFSQRFLPIFEKCNKDKKLRCYRMIIDENLRLCEKYSVEVFPTVIFFKEGKVSKRLDGIHGVGLNEQQLQDLIHVCTIRK